MSLRVQSFGVVLICALASDPTAARSRELPGYRGKSISELRGEWSMAMRAVAEREPSWPRAYLSGSTS
jgi:hypothetical protein